MMIVSVNVGMPRDVKWRGKIVSTAIFKAPVHERVKVNLFNIEGDKQADPSVHGGHDKAVYAYAAEHYESWERELGRSDLAWGHFGENLTIEGGLFEDTVFVGDRFRVGTAEIMAVQPRLPCFKLGIRFGTQRIVRRFAQSGRLGIYFRVTHEGRVGGGDRMEKTVASIHKVSIADLGHLLLGHQTTHTLARRASDIEILPERIRTYIKSLVDPSLP